MVEQRGIGSGVIIPCSGTNGRTAGATTAGRNKYTYTGRCHRTPGSASVGALVEQRNVGYRIPGGNADSSTARAATARGSKGGILSARCYRIPGSAAIRT